MKREKVIDTIRKLLNLSEGTNSPAEAEAAAAKAQQLLLKYNLELDEVKGFIPEEERLVGEELVETSEKKSESNWIWELYGVVARYNFCYTIRHRWIDTNNPYGVKASVIGLSGNVAVVTFTVEWLIPNIRRMAKEAWTEYEGYEKRGRFTRGFLIGCVEGIRSKLHREWEASQVVDENTRALVVVRGREIAEYVRLHFPALSISKPRSLSSWDGKTAGDRAGQDMTIRRGITGDNKFGGYLK